MSKNHELLRAALRQTLGPCVGGLLSAVALPACVGDDTRPAEVTVTVTSHGELVPVLRRIRASVYESDARDGGLPTQTEEFVLSSDLDAGTQAKLPFSFGITKGRSSRFLLVIEGFGSLDPAEAPLIEQKQIGAFTADKSMALTVLLSASCLAPYYPCTGLEQTCWPEARACGPLREARTTPASDRPVLDASALPSRNPLGCPPDACDPNYPCTPTPPEGYVCLGARADFPMPQLGSKTPPSYDLSEPGIALDRVTGLAWQRERPEHYEGCTATQNRYGDLCTLDEAKRYCQRLQLGGRSWRLPSRSELQSLLDFNVSRPPLLDQAVFGTEDRSYWSSSTIPYGSPTSGYLTASWNFFLGVVPAGSPHDPALVRCVSGVPYGRGTPAQRFEVDAQSDTVRDRTTALTWQRTPTWVATSLDQARAYCTALGPDWRLPFTKELLGIMDASRVEPALPDAFPRPMLGIAWTTATWQDGSTSFELVENRLGNPLPLLGRYDPGDTRAHVRCVR